MTQCQFELFKALLFCIMAAYLWRLSRKEHVRGERLWRCFFVGFALILAGFLVGMTKDFPYLNKFIVLGNTPYATILKNGVLHPVGFITVALGIGQLLPFVDKLRKAETALKDAVTALETKVKERTADLEKINQQLAEEINERRRTEVELRQSEQRLELALKGADLGLWDYNIQTGEAVINERRAEMVGYRLEESEPSISWWGSQVHPEDRERVRKAFNAHVTGRTPLYESEHRLHHKSGEYIWILARGKIMEWHGAGYPVRIVGTSLDITDRKRAEEALESARNELECLVEERTAELTNANEQLREQIDERKKVEEALRKSEERYRITFENVKDVILSLNAELEVTNVTPSIEKILGYLPGDLVGRALTDLNLLEPSSLLAALEDARRVLRGETLENRVYSFIHQNGTVRFGEVSSAPLLKDGTIIGLVAVGRDITERKLAEEALSERNQFIDSLLRALPVAVFYKDRDGRYIGCNDTFTKIMGVRSEDMCGKTVHELWPTELAERYHLADLELMRNREHQEYEFRVADKHGQVRPVIFVKDVYLDADGEVAGLVGAFLDITDIKMAESEREKLQQQLLQSQKMESVARLAGGVAHDFNNMLSAILGHAQLGMIRCKPSEQVYADFKEIEESARRSADLVRQLLAFARRQTVAPKVLDVNGTVAGLLKMLLRLMGEDIDLVWMPGARLWPVKIDPSQLDQILANLCVNARDAITGVGKVTIGTQNTSFDAAYCVVHPGLVCGDYVMLSVSDDGCGISKEVLDHIFEPFFTTKELGTGTGLGLATVYGIVKQNEGFINVSSESGQGTTFKIFLPRFVGEATESKSESTSETPRGRGELVLLVEDEAVILKVGRQMLEQLGYNVLTAETPTEALHQARSHAAEIQLLITDVVMPEMNGRDLAKSIDSMKPGLKCLFTSGYTANVIAHHGVLEEDVHFIQKPFSLYDLATKVREALNREYARSTND